jgi:hypothetical protein
VLVRIEHEVTLRRVWVVSSTKRWVDLMTAP